MYCRVYVWELNFSMYACMDNLSPFDSKIACLCQSIEINNSKHIFLLHMHMNICIVEFMYGNCATCILVSWPSPKQWVRDHGLSWICKQHKFISGSTLHSKKRNLIHHDCWCEYIVYTYIFGPWFLWHVLLMFYELVIQMSWIFFQHLMKHKQLIRSQIRTCHDSWAVVSCVNLWPDWMYKIKDRVKIFWIWDNELLVSCSWSHVCSSIGVSARMGFIISCIWQAG